MTEPETTETRRVDSRRVWRQSAIGLALIGGGFVLGAASLATAQGDLGGGMGGGWRYGGGRRVGRLQRMVHGALDNVGATTVQEDRVHDIIARASTDLDKGADEKNATGAQVLALIEAPTLDRAAFDKLRADKVAAMDAKSKVIEDALFDAASQLSPEQRVKLAAEVDARMNGGWGWWHRRHDHDGERGGPDHDRHEGPGRDGGGGPDHG